MQKRQETREEKAMSIVKFPRTRRRKKRPVEYVPFDTGMITHVENVDGVKVAYIGDTAIGYVVDDTELPEHFGEFVDGKPAWSY